MVDTAVFSGPVEAEVAAIFNNIAIQRVGFASATAWRLSDNRPLATWDGV